MDFTSTQQRRRRSLSGDGRVGSSFTDIDSDFGGGGGRVGRSTGNWTEEIRQLIRVLRSAGAVKNDGADGQKDAGEKNDSGGEEEEESASAATTSATDFLFPFAISLFLFLLVLILVVTVVLFVRGPAVIGGAGGGGEGKRGVRWRMKGGKKSGDEGKNDEEEGDGEKGYDEDEEMVGGRGGGQMEEDDPDCWRRVMFWR